MGFSQVLLLTAIAAFLTVLSTFRGLQASLVGAWKTVKKTHSLCKTGVISLSIYFFVHVIPIFIIHTHIYIHMYIDILHVYIHYTYMHACIHRCIHRCIHTCMHACIHTYIPQKWRFGRCSSLPHKSEHSADVDPVGTYDCPKLPFWMSGDGSFR